MTKEIAKRHLYNSVKRFIIAGVDDHKNYRHFKIYRDLIITAQNLKEGDEKELAIMRTAIQLNAFLIPKIEVICSICNSDMLCRLTEQEIIDSFFYSNTPIGNPY